MKMNIEDKDYERVVKLAARFGVTADQLLGRTVRDMLDDMEAQVAYMEMRVARACEVSQADREALRKKLFGDEVAPPPRRALKPKVVLGTKNH